MKHLEDLHEDSIRIPLDEHTTLEDIKNHALALNTGDDTPIETGNILTLEGAEREDGSHLYDDEFTEITEHMEKLSK